MWCDIAAVPFLPHHVVSGYLPDNFDPLPQDEATVEAIHALNREMRYCGMSSPKFLSAGLVAAFTVTTNGENGFDKAVEKTLFDVWLGLG